MSSGDEVICEVIEWAEKGYTEIIIKNAMEILHQFDRSENEYFYMFKPWIHFQEKNTDISIIDSRHIVSTSNPNHILLHQYRVAVNDMHTTSELKDEKFKQEQIEKLSEISRAIDTLSSKLPSEPQKEEKEEKKDNVIKFPGNDILH